MYRVPIDSMSNAVRGYSPLAHFMALYRYLIINISHLYSCFPSYPLRPFLCPRIAPRTPRGLWSSCPLWAGTVLRTSLCLMPDSFEEHGAGILQTTPQLGVGCFPQDQTGVAGSKRKTQEATVITSREACTLPT